MALPSSYQKALETASDALTNPTLSIGEMKPIDGTLEKVGGYLQDTLQMQNLGRVTQQLGTGSYSEIDPAQVVRGATEAAQLVPQVRTTGTALRAGVAALRPALQTIGKSGLQSALPALLQTAPAVGNAVTEGVSLAGTLSGNQSLNDLSNAARTGVRGLNSASMRRDLEIGEQGAQRLAQTNPDILSGLAKAKQLYDKGFQNSELLRQRTGWRTLPGDSNRGPHWAYEISDDTAKLAEGNPSGYLANQLQHPELMDAYPDLGFVERNANPNLPENTRGRMYHDRGMTGVMEYNPVNLVTPQDKITNLIHEVQHWIQRQEGWPQGSNQNSQNVKQAANQELQQITTNNAGLNTDAIKAIQQNLQNKYYLNQAGEAQARAAAERAFYSPMKRKVWPPSMNYDRTPEELIYTY